nr:MAG TPA: hypothetical protein [Caudoviricetes sp.]
MCQNEGAGLYPYPHSFHPFFPPDPGGCRGLYAAGLMHLIIRGGGPHPPCGIKTESRCRKCGNALWLSWKSCLVYQAYALRGG